MRGKNISDRRFTRLIAVEPLEKRIRSNVVWRCKCDCGNEVEIAAVELLRGTTRSCGCLHRDWVDELHEWATGRKRPEFSGKNNPNWKGGDIIVNCSICSETINKQRSLVKDNKEYVCSNECFKQLISQKNSGKNSYNWKGGITPVNAWVRGSLEYKNWRTDVFEKNKYRCQCCGGGGILNAHHIDNFAALYLELDEKLWDINNGVTFCKDCHKVFHKQFGVKNNNRNQIKEFLGYVA